MTTSNLSEQEIIRREKLAGLQQLGVDPYPAALFPVSHYSADILKRYTEETKAEFSQVTLAGRVMSINDKGKVLFIKIQDSQGIIQLYVRRDDLCPGEDKTLFDNVIKHLLDLGDFIGVTGFVFVTRTGETSIHTQTFTLLAKSLKPLPVVKRDEQGNVFDEVTDPEFRYRQRYADLSLIPA
jgi:lysyl-tRNA synthetase class 2